MTDKHYVTEAIQAYIIPTGDAHQVFDSVKLKILSIVEINIKK